MTQFQALALYEIYDFVDARARSSPARRTPRFQAFWDQASAESFRPWSASEKAARAG